MAKHVVFEIAGRKLAVDSSHARELIVAPLVTPLPTAPHAILGLVQMNGRIVPVIDVAARPTVHARPGDPLLVVELNNIRAALLVDRVLGVVDDPVGAETILLKKIFDDLRAT